MRLRVDQYQKMAELMPRMIEAFRAFRDEDEKDQGLSKELEQRTGGLNHQAKELQEAFIRDMLELEGQVKVLLTEAQLAALGRAAAPAPHGDPKALARGVAQGRIEPLVMARDPALAEMADQLRRFEASAHPQLGVIGMQLLHPQAANELYCLAGSKPGKDVLEGMKVLEQGTYECPHTQYEANEKALAELRGEINIWNLVNGLHLMSKQVDSVRQCAQAAQALREGFFREAWGPQGGERGLLARLVNRSTEEPGRFAGALAAAPAVMGDIYQIERKVRAVLTDTQQQVIRDYKPCLVPPKNLRDPVRIGQANDASASARQLERLRKVPPGRLEEAAERALAAEQEHLGPYKPDELAARRKLLVETARASAAMSDTEFEIHKDELAEKIQPGDRKQELQHQLNDGLAARGVPGKIARFLLLDEHVIPVLARRAGQLANPVAARPQVAANGPAAENCDGGKCALPGRASIKRK